MRRREGSQTIVRHASTLTWLWAVYFVVVFTVGRFSGWDRITVWIGGLLVIIPSTILLMRRIWVVPAECLLLTAFLGWSLLGGFRAEDWAAYTGYVRLTLELLVVVALLGASIRLSGRITLFWWCFMLVAVFNTIGAALDDSFQLAASGGPMLRTRGLTDNANGLGFLCFTGILGALGIMGEKVRNRLRALALAAAGLAFWGLVATASRGALLATVLALVLWPVLCLRFGRDRRWLNVLAALVIVLVLYFGLTWVSAETNLGSRISGQDLAHDSRFTLVAEGLRLAKENLLIGVGLGQFAVATGAGEYAHTEWVELLATTGIPGLVLMVSVYWLVWRRLGRSLRALKDPVVRYRVNFTRMTTIILVVAGIVFRPLFIHMDSMFMLALVVGMSWWAQDQVVVARRLEYASREGLVGRTAITRRSHRSEAATDVSLVDGGQ